jgi:hypothetical protein
MSECEAPNTIREVYDGTMGTWVPSCSSETTIGTDPRALLQVQAYGDLCV